MYMAAHLVGFLEEGTLDITGNESFFPPTEIYSSTLRNVSILSSGRFKLASESEGKPA